MVDASSEVSTQFVASERSDIDSYLARFPDEDQQEVAHADLALDLVVLAQRVADGEANWLEGLQQSFTRLDQAGERLDLAMLEKYLNELGYSFRLMTVESAAPAHSPMESIRSA